MRALAVVPVNKQLSAERRAAFFDGARPGFADRHRVWLAREANW